MDALLNTIEILVMLGDPDLNQGNRHEWISLILKCLPFKTLPKHLDCSQDARCLQHVASCFEEFTLHSTLFQVSSAAESKRKHLLKFREKDHRCIFSATMTVRMWTTTNEEVTVPPEDGDKKNCAFCSKSTIYNQLLSIPNGATRFSISGTPAPIAVLEAQKNDRPRTHALIEGPVKVLNRNAPSSPVDTFRTMGPLPVTDIVSLRNSEFTGGTETEIASSAEDESRLIDYGDQHSELEGTKPDSLYAVATEGPKNAPCHNSGVESLGLISPEQVRHIVSGINGAQESMPDISSARKLPHVARRFPFLYMEVPGRDTKFYGREEFLILLQDLLTPIAAPTNDNLAKLVPGAVVFLYGVPGVGKSAIALELTYRTQDVFDHVFWLRASSNLHLAQSFHQAATSLGLVQDRGNHNHESSKQKFMDWLSTTCSNWLLVFDNADELQLLPDFVPKRRHGSIIVTSRQTPDVGLDFDNAQCLHKFHVGPFHVEDATEFIRTLAPFAFGAADTAADVATLTTIAESCGYLPFTLRRVGILINHLGSLKDKQVIETIEQHASRVLASQPSSPIYASLSSASWALANVIAFLDPYCIDDAILLGAQRYKNIPYRGFPMKDDRYFDAKKELVAHALLTVGTKANAIDIHRLTASALRAKLDPDNFRDGFQSACLLLEARWPSRRKMKNIMLGNWPEFDSLHSHVHELSKIFVEYDRKRKNGEIKQELSNDSYLNVLLLSTW